MRYAAICGDWNWEQRLSTGFFCAFPVFPQTFQTNPIGGFKHPLVWSNLAGKSINFLFLQCKLGDFHSYWSLEGYLDSSARNTALKCDWNMLKTNFVNPWKMLGDDFMMGRNHDFLTLCCVVKMRTATMSMEPFRRSLAAFSAKHLNSQDR